MHDLVVELRTVLGFDQATSAKRAPYTLGRQRGTLLLAQLRSIAARAEALADDETERGH
jgi:hypothetical protein